MPKKSIGNSKGFYMPGIWFRGHNDTTHQGKSNPVITVQYRSLPDKVPAWVEGLEKVRKSFLKSFNGRHQHEPL